MFLSRPDILTYLQDNRLRFEPAISEDRVAQVSIDLLLGRRFTTFKEKLGYLTSIRMDPSLWDSVDLWENTEADTFLLGPSQFVLAQTLERVHIPNTLLGLVEGRSSYARIGVTVHVTFFLAYTQEYEACAARAPNNLEYIKAHCIPPLEKAVGQRGYNLSWGLSMPVN